MAIDTRAEDGCLFAYLNLIQNRRIQKQDTEKVGQNVLSKTVLYCKNKLINSYKHFISFDYYYNNSMCSTLGDAICGRKTQTCKLWVLYILIILITGSQFK